MKTKLFLLIIGVCFEMGHFNVAMAESGDPNTKDIWVSNERRAREDRRADGSEDRPYPTIAQAIKDLDSDPNVKNIIHIQASSQKIDVNNGTYTGGSYANCPYEETITITDKIVEIKTYRTTIKGNIGGGRANIVPKEAKPGQDGKAAITVTGNKAHVTLRGIRTYGQKGGRAALTDPNSPGHKGGPAIRAENGATVIKRGSPAKGGDGGDGRDKKGNISPWGTATRGGGGAACEVADGNNTTIRNKSKSPGQGGTGGTGGDPPMTAGADGGDGGPGAIATNGAVIEQTPSSQCYGGYGGPGGDGSPPGVAGADGVDDVADTNSSILDIPEGDEDLDGIPDDMDPCPEDPNLGCEPDWGACMLPDGSCVEADAAFCGVVGGIYDGNGTECPEELIFSDCPEFSIIIGANDPMTAVTITESSVEDIDPCDNSIVFVDVVPGEAEGTPVGWSVSGKVTQVITDTAVTLRPTNMLIKHLGGVTDVNGVIYFQTDWFGNIGPATLLRTHLSGDYVKADVNGVLGTGALKAADIQLEGYANSEWCGLVDPPCQGVNCVPSAPADANFSFGPPDDPDMVINGPYVRSLSGAISFNLGPADTGPPAVEADAIYLSISAVINVVEDPGLPCDTQQITGDISGPDGIPDCRVDFYDMAALAKHWLDETTSW